MGNKQVMLTWLFPSGEQVMQRASPLHSDAGPTANFIVFHAFVNVSRQVPDFACPLLSPDFVCPRFTQIFPVFQPDLACPLEKTSRPLALPHSSG